MLLSTCTSLQRFVNAKMALVLICIRCYCKNEPRCKDIYDVVASRIHDIYPFSGHSPHCIFQTSSTLHLPDIRFPFVTLHLSNIFNITFAIHSSHLPLSRYTTSTSRVVVNRSIKTLSQLPIPSPRSSNSTASC